MEDFQNKEADIPKENPQEEEELLKETPSDELKQSIIEKYELNEETDEKLINKLIEGELESQKKLSTAIKQKRGWREKAEARTEQKLEEKPQPVQFDEKVLDQKLNEKLEERELESLDISDELKSEIKTYAKAGGLTIKKALQSEYFKFLKIEDEKKQKVEEATIGGKRRAPSRQEFKVEKFPEVDMTTEEGRKTWEDYKKFLKSQE